jgi:hypothetical protein
MIERVGKCLAFFVRRDEERSTVWVEFRCLGHGLAITVGRDKIEFTLDRGELAVLSKWPQAHFPDEMGLKNDPKVEEG